MKKKKAKKVVKKKPVKKALRHGSGQAKKVLKKKIVKKPLRRSSGQAKKILKKKAGKPLDVARGKPIGVVTHFYTAIKVAIVKFKEPVRVGVRIKFKGATTDFEETIKSMQYDHKPVMVAPKGKQMGIKVGKRVRENDEVYAV